MIIVASQAEHASASKNRFHMAVEAAPKLLELLMNSAEFTEKGISSQKGKAGIYVFFENEIPVHVGRTRNLSNRLRGHITKSHYSASFAFKRARKAVGKLATYKTIGSRQSLSEDDVFKEEFYRQINLVKNMIVKFVEVKDPVNQYILELYASVEFNLPLDEFDTH